MVSLGSGGATVRVGGAASSSTSSSPPWRSTTERRGRARQMAHGSRPRWSDTWWRAIVPSARGVKGMWRVSVSPGGSSSGLPPSSPSGHSADAGVGVVAEMVRARVASEAASWMEVAVRGTTTEDLRRRERSALPPRGSSAGSQHATQESSACSASTSSPMVAERGGKGLGAEGESRTSPWSSWRMADARGASDSFELSSATEHLTNCCRLRSWAAHERRRPVMWASTRHQRSFW
mmetsp:Transcript_43329/g.119820  ORF Transcript_43329/g.119820 Transcript_43329/m.119820 type:complete len:235 (+) Transcript_43329:243-947(+)